MNPSVFSHSDLFLVRSMLQSYSTYVEARIEDNDLETNQLKEEIKNIDYICDKIDNHKNKQ